MYLSSKQFDYKKQVESHLMERIENILSPVLGDDGLRTQVTADVDFTITERTRESFNPDLPALRSEQTSEDQSRLPATQGVPGALSNQPPASGTAPEIALSGEANNAGASLNSSKNITRNYELKYISSKPLFILLHPAFHNWRLNMSRLWINKVICWM